MAKKISVLVGAGSIGQAIIRRVSPGIIITPLANDELHGPRKEGYLKMIEGMPARRAGTPDEVGDLAEFLMSSRGRFSAVPTCSSTAAARPSIGMVICNI